MSPPRLSLINNLPAIEVQLPMRVKHLTRHALIQMAARRLQAITVEQDEGSN